MNGRTPLHQSQVILICLLSVITTPVSASVSDICVRAAQAAAHAHNVPAEVLIAIAQTETGRNSGGYVEPWPWTLNVEGQGYWLATRAQTLAQAQLAIADGKNSFDLGCFQLNYRWHGQHFASLDQMLDPRAGADYAAKFLAGLYAETGDWSAAAGAYHSRTAVHAARYRRQFDPLYAAALQNSGTDFRANTFPLLQQGGAVKSLGSLVPVSARVTE